MAEKTLAKDAGYAALAILLTLLVGCATGGRVTEPQSADEPPAVLEGPAVTRFEDGREGFVIRETPAMDPESREAFARAVALMDEQDYPGAIELLQKVIEQSPGVTAPYIDLAMACRQTGPAKQAEEYLKTALSLVPGHPVASNEYGLLLRRDGRFAEARAVYEQALETFPEYLPLRRNLGILCDLYLNDPAAALEHYEIYGQGRPEDEQIKLWIADLRLRLGRR
jgi:tetratricopeptide (TPR) repeat protein